LTWLLTASLTDDLQFQKYAIFQKTNFFISLQLVFNSSFFSFDNIIYRQKFGMLMGSPLSPVIADLVLKDLEKKALNTLTFHIPFHYIDDIAIRASAKKNRKFQVFNSFHFTVHD